MVGRKRVYAGYTPSVSKKARTTRRRRFKRKGRRTASFSSKGGASSFGFRGKKLSVRSYRNMLWRDSIMKTKWKTVQAFTQGQATPANSALFSVGIYDAFGNTASPFWTAAGGTIATDFGAAVPTFSGDIIVRGGILGIRLSNQAADTQPQEVKVILFRTIDRQGVAPPAVGNQFVGFELEQLTDFKQFYGVPLMTKTALLENSNVVEFKYRLKVQKVDQYQFNQIAKRYYWMVAVGGTESAAASTATITQFWNASFVADAV